MTNKGEPLLESDGICNLSDGDERLTSDGESDLRARLEFDPDAYAEIDLIKPECIVGNFTLISNRTEIRPFTPEQIPENAYQPRGHEHPRYFTRRHSDR